jgi:hypothetical protein
MSPRAVKLSRAPKRGHQGRTVPIYLRVTVTHCEDWNADDRQVSP